MKRIFQWILAAILICGVTTFTSCTNEDNPADPAANLSEMIIGKWIVTEIKGQPELTNKKRVYNFGSPTKAYISASDGIGPVVSLNWLDKTEAAWASGFGIEKIQDMYLHQWLFLAWA